MHLTQAPSLPFSLPYIPTFLFSVTLLCTIVFAFTLHHVLSNVRSSSGEIWSFFGCLTLTATLLFALSSFVCNFSAPTLTNDGLTSRHTHQLSLPLDRPTRSTYTRAGWLANASLVGYVYHHIFGTLFAVHLALGPQLQVYISPMPKVSLPQRSVRSSDRFGFA